MEGARHDGLSSFHVWQVLTSPSFHVWQVLATMDNPPPLQLVSFHSTSKGFLGECGLRGGYFELVGFDPEVKAQLLKLVSIGLCSNTLGQIATGLMVAPPKPGSASHATFANQGHTQCTARAVRLPSVHC